MRITQVILMGTSLHCHAGWEGGGGEGRGGDGVRCNSFLTEVNAVGQLRDRSQVARTVLVSAVIQRVLWVQLDGTASARFDALEKTVDLVKVVKI